jgi:hypothetical protein
MQAIIHAADLQDRDGGVLLMGALFGLYPFLLTLYADSGYQGPKFQNGLHAVCGRINLEIVKRSDRHKFVVLPKRWIVIGCTKVPDPISSGRKRLHEGTYTGVVRTRQPG